MENQNKTLLTVIGVATLLVAIVGASFAYFSATGTSTQQQVTTGKLMLTATSNADDEANIKPTTWDSATAADADTDIAKVKLSVVTDGTTISTGVYNVYLTTTGIALNTAAGLTGGSLSEVKWALYDDTNKTTALGNGDFTAGNANTLKINTSDIAIPSGTNTDNLTLYIWIANDTENPQNQLQSLTIGATLSAVASQQPTA